MEINNNFEGLDRLRRRLGAPEKKLSFDEEMAPLSDIELKLKTEGIIVDREDIQSVGPYLTYRGQRLAILYILNSNSPSFELTRDDPSKKAPKFHLTWCRTLEQMTKIGRLERYVLSRSESNLFRVEAHEHEPESIKKYGEYHMLNDVRLFPCQNCLNDLEYKGFELKQPKPSRMEQINDFVVREFLEENDGNLTVMKHLPSTTALTAKGGGYRGFAEISRRLREQHGWTCSSCNIDMTEKKSGLHVHHLNGQKHDNRPSNLKVLCALCHRDVDQFHKTMPIDRDIVRYIETHRPSS